MNSQHLLVPIKVQALVIDDSVIKRSGTLLDGSNYIANDGRWSPEMYNYHRLTTSLMAPGPSPFYGASRSYNGKQAAQLVFENDSPALPHDEDRGVYLHWVLPAGLRHAYTPGLLDFPALPDHWLIVRFSRRGSELKTKAWFVDSSIVVSETENGNLLFAGKDKYVPKRVGKVVPFDQFAAANSSGERTTLTAVGNAFTGSPTFTAFIAENRNVFSMHDKLDDLRASNTVSEDTTLTYSVLGWYRDPDKEPLISPASKVIEQKNAQGKLLGWLIDPPGWFIDAKSTPPVELLKRRSVFHGMVAHINYWSGRTYKGQLLGYPGSPRVGGTLSKSAPPFKVGVGNSAEDALVSLVSSEYSGEQEVKSLAKEQPNLWKAVEAVIYRQTETVVRSWNVAPRDMAVHQNWFATRDAGKIWYIRPEADQEGVFPSYADKTAAQTAIRPTAEQLAKLKELNKLQSEADAVARELAALQQELYARWWKLCNKTHQGLVRSLDPEQSDCSTLADQVKAVRDKLIGQLNSLRPLPDDLKKILPKELVLKYDSAPRFWMPADPVVVVKNCGSPTKHQFPRQLPCRLPEQIVTAGKVEVKGLPDTIINTPSGVAEIAAAAQKHLPAAPDVLTGLLNEASIVEQAIRDLATRTVKDSQGFRDAGEWEQWTTQLVNDMTWDGDTESVPHDKINFGKKDAFDIRPHRLADLWVQQPWSPLFIDWQITWFPTTQAPTTEQPFGPVWSFREADFVPLDRRSIPTTGYTIRGRSLLSPIDDRIFKEPIATLRQLLGGVERKNPNTNFPAVVREVLSRYEIVWDKTLGELANVGLMGQALTGFHQSLLYRDVSLPHVNPDSTRPWVNNDKVKALETKVTELLDVPEGGLIGERLAPPATRTSKLPFSMIRAGALRIDELWLIDDFGQSADLLGRTTAGSQSSGQVFHPRMRWHDDKFVFAMPPRILQPVRLNFRFVASESATEEPGQSGLAPICGWIFYNPLDHALVLCDRNGELLGHLAIVKDQRGLRVKWEASAGGVEISQIRDLTLKTFAESLIDTTPKSNPRLVELLNLIDNALERIRPATARRDTVLVGRPLALVNATIGLELFGKAWTDPRPKLSPAGEGAGDEKLNALRVRVNLGYSHSVEDGLVGYFKGGAYDRIVTAQVPQELKTSNYVGDQQTHCVRVGFGAPERITLLMDPWGSVQAACGIVPSKTITLAQAELDKTAARMEASFRVGPVLLQSDRLALPAPTGSKGKWNFAGPTTNQKAAAVVAVDPKYFSDQPVIATEGRLLLLNED
jgi:hypothetical protein